MEEFLIRLLQFMLAISLLVLLHEGGHFFFSKLFGVRVDKFYLFFDPWFHLFEYKPKKSDTTYGIGWLPLGGYCKIAGMIDESFDTEQMKQPPQPWEFRTKPAWQRLLIMTGGVLVNFLLALFIYAMVLFAWGDSYFKTIDLSMGWKFNTEAKKLGFQDHDILVGYDGKEFGKFNVDVYRHIADAQTVHVIRNTTDSTGKVVATKKLDIKMPGDMSLLTMLKDEPVFARPFIPAEIDSVMPNSPAMKAGIKKGDKLLAINGKPIDSWNEFNYQRGVLTDMLATAQSPADSMKVRNVTVTIERANDAQQSSLNPQPSTLNVTLTPDLLLGVTQTSIATYYKPTDVKYGFFESLPAGVAYGWNTLKGYVSDLRYVFSAEGAKSLGGFGAIGSLFPPTWDWHSFWLMTAFLSIILAFMNILPIPALDGGHVLFLIYEMITGRKPSEKFLLYAEYFGFGLLLLLMVVANLNDILRWLGYI